MLFCNGPFFTSNKSRPAFFAAEDEKFGDEVVQDDDNHGDDDLGRETRYAEQVLVQTQLHQQGQTAQLHRTGEQPPAHKAGGLLDPPGPGPALGFKDPQLVGHEGKGHRTDPAEDVAHRYAGMQPAHEQGIGGPADKGGQTAEKEVADDLAVFVIQRFELFHKLTYTSRTISCSSVRTVQT